MSRRHSYDETVARISLYDLTTYMVQTGWNRAPSKSDRWSIFRTDRPGGESLELIVPNSEDFSDVNERIRELVSALAQIEDRDPSEISADLISTNSDSLQIRLKISEKNDSVPIADAAKHVRALKNLLMYSACSELQAKPHFEQPIPASLDLLSNFDFCHTFRGSFGFEITNTILQQQISPDMFRAPIQRRIFERIARGVKLLKDAVSTESPDLIIETYEIGLNAKMCDALTDVSVNGEVTFSLEVDWARTLQPIDDLRGLEPVIIGEKEISLLRFAAEQLKVVRPHADRIIGQVVNLHCSADPTMGNAKRTIALRVEHSKHGMIEVKIALGPKAYLLGIETHSKGKMLVASGQLQRKGNTWTLDSVTHIEAVP